MFGQKPKVSQISLRRVDEISRLIAAPLMMQFPPHPREDPLIAYCSIHFSIGPIRPIRHELAMVNNLIA